jgi:hypothetical protein
VNWEDLVNRLEHEMEMDRIGWYKDMPSAHIRAAMDDAVWDRAMRSGRQAGAYAARHNLDPEERCRRVARQAYRNALEAGLTEAQAFYIGMHCAKWFGQPAD